MTEKTVRFWYRPVLPDGLTYSYSNYTNKLLSVSDSKSGTLGYKSPNGGNDFVYDNNGNLTNDADKGIGINYNVLNPRSA